MDIKISNLTNGTLEWFENVDKVIFHSDQGSVEYINTNCVNHSSPSTAFSIITPTSEAVFATDKWYIAKASQ